MDLSVTDGDSKWNKQINETVLRNKCGTKVIARLGKLDGWHGCNAKNGIPMADCYKFKRWAILLTGSFSCASLGYHLYLIIFLHIIQYPNDTMMLVIILRLLLPNLRLMKLEIIP